MFKTILLRFLIVFFLSVILFFGYLFCSFVAPSFHWGWEPMVDALASIETYIDKNADGIKDEDELPLAEVCVGQWPYLGYNFPLGERIGSECLNPYDSTDPKGRWGEFKPGSKCTDLILYAVVPEGYQPTTDLVVNDCYAHFGFISAGSIPQKNVLTLKDLLGRKAAEEKLKLIAIMAVCIAISIFVSISVVRIHPQSIETTTIMGA